MFRCTRGVVVGLVRASIALSLLSPTGCSAQTSEAVKVESALARQEEEIRRFVEFDRVAASIDARAGVAAAWPDLRQFFPEGERNWELYRDQVNFTDVGGLIERISILRQGEAQITVDVFVSSRGPRLVLQRLVETMAATSIGYRRYEFGPKDIGQLCLVLPLPNATVLVVDRNVFVRIRRTNHSMDLVPLARAFAKFMDSNVVQELASKSPTVAGLSLDPETPRVNERAKLMLRLPPGFQATDLMWSMSADVDSETVEVRDQGPDSAELRLQKAGQLVIPVWLADRRTLLSSETRISIDVRK